MRHEHRGGPHTFVGFQQVAFRRASGEEGRGERRERSDRERHGRPGGGRGRHGGFGGRREFEDAEPVAVSTEAITAWLTGRLPEGWFTTVGDVVVDRDEITVVGTLPTPDGAPEAGTEAAAEAEAGRISRFREETRDQRVAIAQEAEQRYGRTIAWGARAGETAVLFTNRSVPVMTRLRQPERQVLDTLVDAGVARSRSDALAWCVRLVGRNSDEWLGQLRDAMSHVERVRDQGPGA